MECKNCGEYFNKKVVIDGRARNLQRRKYCFKCSPFDCHNTKKIENAGFIKSCKMCGKIILRKKEKGKNCWTCANRKNRQEKLEKIKSFTGDACWECGYNKCWGALDFHHVYPEEKSFSLTMCEIQFSWERIFPEIKKCVLLCCRCHREVHAGLISEERVLNIWKNHWN
jgi:hypothetical protein